MNKILFLIAAVLFGVDAWKNGSLQSAAFCLITLALWVV